jgi:hypothetical protein
MSAEEHSPQTTGVGGALRGEVVYLYAFDVANEVRLDRVPALLSAHGTPLATGPAPAARSVPRSIPVARPVAVEPPAPSLRLRGEPIRVLVRVYEVGVVTVTVRVSFADGSLAGLTPFHTPALDDGRPLDLYAREQCAEIRRKLADALVRPEPETEPEAYTVFCLTHLGGSPDANRWLAEHQREVAGLLTATPAGRLSEAQVAEVLRLKRSFENTDLAVLDWEAALVVDLGGKAEEVLFVLELANLQLEEFRWMDRALDRYLEQAYDDFARRRWWRPGGGAAVLRSLRGLRIDLAKLADEVTHTTKFIGDWHLARVYILARERFHLDQWRASVDQRLDELDRLYTILRGDVYDRRMLWLEIVIVVFFALDLLLILYK